MFINLQLYYIDQFLIIDYIKNKLQNGGLHMKSLFDLFTLNEVNLWIFKFGRKGKKWYF